MNILAESLIIIFFQYVWQYVWCFVTGDRTEQKEDTLIVKIKASGGLKNNRYSFERTTQCKTLRMTCGIPPNCSAGHLFLAGITQCSVGQRSRIRLDSNSVISSGFWIGILPSVVFFSRATKQFCLRVRSSNLESLQRGGILLTLTLSL